MPKTGKRLREARDNIKPDQDYDLAEAVEILKNHSSKNFDETIELAVNLGVDPKHSDQNVRGVCNLPHGTGKQVRVAVFARDAKAEEAKEAGADIVGAEDLMESVQAGRMDFDRVIATPDMMALVGRLGKILGPRGLMPNPKVGTVTPDVAKAVKDAKTGSVEFRVEKAGIIHVGVGKSGFAPDAIIDNIRAIAGAIVRAKPSGAKGVYIRKISVSSTHGPGIQLNTQSVLAN